MSFSSSPGFASVILTIHDPCASELIFSNAVVSSSLIAVTLPEAGANRSETAFTDSTEPKVLPALTSAPTFGSSTKTMSPSACWAWSVMPIVAEPPSALIHSCSFVYLRSVGKPMLSSLAFFRTLVERCWNNLRGDALPANLYLYFGPNLRKLRRNVCQRDVLLEERRG